MRLIDRVIQQSQHRSMIFSHMSKKEARDQGIPAQSRRSATCDEYKLFHKTLKEHGKNIIWKYGAPAKLNYQFHMIARLDDCMNVPLNNLKAHPDFDFCLMTKLAWSKNVREERDAPWKIMIGSIDSVYCVLISLGIWLEIYFMECNYSNDSPYLFALSPDCRFPQGAQSGKTVLRRIMGESIFKSLGLTAKEAIGNDGRGLGTHSFRKYGATHATKCGISRDNRDYRGRWKRDRRVSCVYDDVELPWVDCEVAAALCVGDHVSMKYRIPL
jgi:hypothetical protein